MAITKRTEVDQIRVTANGNMTVREILYVEEDGVVIASSMANRTVEPDADVTNETEDVKAVAGAVHTPERKAAWAEKKAAKEPEQTQGQGE